MIEQKTWNHPSRQRDVFVHGRIEDGVVARGLALAVAVIVAASFVLWAVLELFDIASVSESLPSFVTCSSFFVGFLAAGLYVATTAKRDRMLQVTVLVIGGFVLAAIGTLLDAVFQFSLGDLMPGNNVTDAEQIHLGFWAISWVAVPTAAYLAAAVVPRRGETWGTQTSEPEDTEL